jgi:methionine sulfoxide reductase heme-binding subunit
MPKVTRWWILKPVVFIACLGPTVWGARAIWLTYQGIDAGLGANPIKDVTEVTGIWTLRFLMITLAITPLRRITGWNSLIRFRRMMGLFTFFQAFAHLTTYIWLDQFFAWGDIAKDIVKRPFITSGMAGFTLMVPLAITSTKKWIARLGGKRWQLLHRLIYLSGIAGVIHYYFFVKSDIQDPLAYASLLLILLGFRGWIKSKDAKAQKPRTAAEIGTA